MARRDEGEYPWWKQPETKSILDLRLALGLEMR
jgi:hypothetical protein